MKKILLVVCVLVLAGIGGYCCAGDVSVDDPVTLNITVTCGPEHLQGAHVKVFNAENFGMPLVEGDTNEQGKVALSFRPVMQAGNEVLPIKQIQMTVSYKNKDYPYPPEEPMLCPKPGTIEDVHIDMPYTKKMLAE